MRLEKIFEALSKCEGWTGWIVATKASYVKKQSNAVVREGKIAWCASIVTVDTR
jgi:hypothetical protein